jgi:hypothetical protein
MRDNVGAVPDDFDVLPGGMNTLSTFSFAINSKNGLRSMPGANASITTASSLEANCATQSSG